MRKALEELMAQWDAEVAHQEKVAHECNRKETMCRSRCWARAWSIANCRRELKQLLDRLDESHKGLREALEKICEEEEAQALRSYGLGDIAREALRQFDESRTAT